MSNEVADFAHACTGAWALTQAKEQAIKVVAASPAAKQATQSSGEILVQHDQWISLQSESKMQRAPANARGKDECPFARRISRTALGAAAVGKRRSQMHGRCTIYPVTGSG